MIKTNLSLEEPSASTSRTGEQQRGAEQEGGAQVRRGADGPGTRVSPFFTATKMSFKVGK